MPAETKPETPVNSFLEAAPLLRRPFSPNAVHFKVQTQTPKQNPTRGLIVGYIDARLVAERLNLVCPHLWHDTYRPYGERIDSGLLICDLTIDGITRSDVGEGKGKTGYSDAFKRAAVKFGVGVSLYAMSQVWLDVGKTNGKPTLDKRSSGGKTYLNITPEADAWLCKKYEAWVQRGDGKVFGDVLDHGDAEGSVGAAMDEPSAAVEEPNLEIAGKREEAEALYAQLDPADRPNLPPARFKAQLDGAELVEDVDKLIERVRGLK